MGDGVLFILLQSALGKARGAVDNQKGAVDKGRAGS